MGWVGRSTLLQLLLLLTTTGTTDTWCPIFPLPCEGQILHHKIVLTLQSRKCGKPMNNLPSDVVPEVWTLKHGTARLF